MKTRPAFGIGIITEGRGASMFRIIIWALVLTCMAPPAWGATVPMHVLTADYLGGPENTALPATVVAPWVTWTETSWQYDPEAVAAGIKTMYYTNPNRINDTNPMRSADESVYAHDCSGNRLASLHYEHMYLADPASPALRAKFQWVIRSRSANRHWDAFFVDDANTMVGLSGLPCNYDPEAWLAAEKQLIASVDVPIVYNGLENNATRALNDVPNVIGGMEEGCYSGSVRFPKMWDRYWTQIENTEIAMARDGKLFFCYGKDTTDASRSVDGRIYTYASFLLTYTPDKSILWEYYSTASKFRVEPETKLVALNPVVPTPLDISALQQPSGVYGREYQSCYLAGSPVGPCAAVVNPSRSQTHAYPYGNKYEHTLVLSGGGILDEGTVSTQGPPPPQTLGPLEAVIVFR